MATYVSLLRFTDQGIRNIKDSPSRLEQVKKVLQASGGELKAFYLALGKYDAIVVSEAPNDEVVAKVLLQIGAAGNTRTETMRVFGEPEYRKVISTLP
jgi:uncharacterized protein with GYD domain